MTTPAARPAPRRRHVFVTVLIILHLVVCLLILYKNASNPKTNERLASSDSINYVEIANDFASGNFSFDYVQHLPHRQPLYPALLAIAIKLGGGDRFVLGAVNVLIASGSILLIYIVVIRSLQSQTAANVVALALAVNPFIDRQITARLLTEPLHLFLTIGAIAMFIRYLKGYEQRWMFGCAALLGLDYLTRPNGLFMAATACVAMGLADSIRYGSTEQRQSAASWVLAMVGRYGGALIIFLFVSAPSWVPRMIYYHSPFHHGYLSNYMWVDTYAQAHVGSSYATFTWKDYIEHHNLFDALARFFRGLRNIYIRIPATMERVPILYLLGLAGVYCGFQKSTSEYRYLFLFLFLEMLPLVWTNLSNPTARVPYGSTLPFELFFAALFVSIVASNLRVRTWFTQRFARKPTNQ
jgi:4-amino-4-deoxy-L-arabinose transferase-like glycosyltransferase